MAGPSKSSCYQRAISGETSTGLKMNRQDGGPGAPRETPRASRAGDAGAVSRAEARLVLGAFGEPDARDEGRARMGVLQ